MGREGRDGAHLCDKLNHIGTGSGVCDGCLYKVIATPPATAADKNRASMSCRVTLVDGVPL